MEDQKSGLGMSSLPRLFWRKYANATMPPTYTTRTTDRMMIITPPHVTPPLLPGSLVGPPVGFVGLGVPVGGGAATHILRSQLERKLKLLAHSNVTTRLERSATTLQGDGCRPPIVIVEPNRDSTVVVHWLLGDCIELRFAPAIRAPLPNERVFVAVFSTLRRLTRCGAQIELEDMV